MSAAESRIVNLLWNVPDHIGGMTSYVLTRTELLAAGGHDCETIVFSPKQRRASDRLRLTERGSFSSGGCLSNLWDILAEDPLEEFQKGNRPAQIATPIPATDRCEEWSDDAVLRVRTHFAKEASGRSENPVDTSPVEVQRDHFRADGSLLLVDRLAGNSSGMRGVAEKVKRLVTLYRQDGTPIRSWRSIWKLYEFVLDRHLSSVPTVLFLDSKVTSQFAMKYRRPNVQTLHVVHNLHLSSSAEPPFAPLNSTRAVMMRELFRFDQVVCSTDQQRRDMKTLLEPSPKIAVIPPAIAAIPHAQIQTQTRQRPVGQGVVLASLEPRKRIDHLIEAVRQARVLAPESDLRLDIYGTGPEQQRLERAIDDAGLVGIVQLRGHHTNAKEAFATASWTAMTSTHEGFGMAIAEAMSAGCVPFSYDISYGPGDLLAPFPDHLVDAGNPEALAQRIAGFALADEEDRVGLRLLALKHSESYRPEAVAALWLELIAGLLGELPRPLRPVRKPRILAFRSRRSERDLTIEVDLGWSRKRKLPEVSLGLAASTPPIEWRKPANVRRLPGTRVRAQIQLQFAEFPIVGELSEMSAVAVLAGERVILEQALSRSSRTTLSWGVRGIRYWMAAAQRKLFRTQQT